MIFSRNSYGPYGFHPDIQNNPGAGGLLGLLQQAVHPVLRQREAGLWSNQNATFPQTLGRYTNSQGLLGRLGALQAQQKQPVNGDSGQVDLPYTIFARPPIVPRQLTPLEELPKGSRGDPGARKPFSRSLREQEPPPCTYCRRPTMHEPGPDQLQGDHVIPRAHGGNNDPTNRVPSCRTCNIQKKDRTPEQWYLWLRGKGA